jgi:hypothetical protein
MREGRGKGDHGLVLKNESVEAAQGHSAVMIDQKEKVLERKGDAFPFLNPRVKMAIVA